MAVIFSNTAADAVISLGTADFLRENAAISLSCWLFPVSSGGGGLGMIMFRMGASTNSALGISFQVRSANDGYGFNIDGGTAIYRRTTASTVSYNSWQNIVLTWTGGTAGTSINMYKNGTEMSYSSTQSGATPSNTGTRTTYVGNRQTWNRLFDGYISEMALWSVVVGTGTIAALGNARVRGLPLRLETASLVSYWPLDDLANGVSGDGVTFRDRWGTNTGTGSDGTANTGIAGTSGDPLSYLLQNENIYPRGVMRGVYQ